jgi:prepilin-type processing-associated H-X9-DG protein
VPRVRSMCMSIWMGGFGGRLTAAFGGIAGDMSSPPWRLYLRLSDILDPGPSGTLLFLDEREDAIGTGNFAVDMIGFPNQPESLELLDMPASYHNLAGGVSFVDGHAEIKRWRDARTTPPLGSGNGAIKPSPTNQDVIWLQQRATRMN